MHTSRGDIIAAFLLLYFEIENEKQTPLTCKR